MSNRNFGSQLSGGPSPTPAAASRQQAAASSSAAPAAPAFPVESADAAPVDISSLPPQDRARVARHRGVIERAQTFLGNNETKMNRFRNDVSAYRTGTLDAPQFLDALFMLFSETSSNSLGILVRELAELFEDPKKADGLRKAWQDWRAINEDYPSLPGLGGMHGATTASSGWASAATASPSAPGAAGAQKHSTRVLKLKSATRQPSISAPSSAASSWTAPATSSRPPPPRTATGAFPALPSRPAGSSTPRPSWVASASSGARPAPRRPPGEDAFPALPAAPKPVTSIFGYGRGSVRRDWGQNADTGFSWGAEAEAGPAEEEEEVGKKKGKGKGKKVLVQWG